MASGSTLLAHMNRTEIPRYRKSLHVACSACTHEGRANIKPMNIWEWLTHARVVHNWALSRMAPCLLCGHLCASGPGLQRHFSTQHSDKLGEQSENVARLSAGEMQGTHDLKELHGVEKHLLGQSAGDVAGRKRSMDCDMDGEYTAPAAKRTKSDGDGECPALAAKSTEGDGDGKCPAPPARRTESDSNKECPAPPIKRARAARHNVAHKELSPVVMYDADSNPCEDVISAHRLSMGSRSAISRRIIWAQVRPWILGFLGMSTPPFSPRGGQLVPSTTLPRYPRTFRRPKRSGGRGDAMALAIAKQEDLGDWVLRL